MYICRAWLKHGYSNFSLTIIEYCEVSELLTKEKYWVKLFNPEYNIIQDPTVPPMSGRKHSDKSKTKISDALVGNTNGFKKSQPRPEGAGSPSQAIEVTDKKNNTTTSYDSISEAARALNIPNHSIILNYILRNQQKPYKGRYTFKKL